MCRCSETSREKPPTAAASPPPLLHPASSPPQTTNAERMLLIVIESSPSSSPHTHRVKLSNIKVESFNVSAEAAKLVILDRFFNAWVQLGG